MVDGSGGPPFNADVGIKGDRIVRVSKSINEAATRTINATTLVVAPGFIDPHSHADLTAILYPTAERSLRQGITTEIVGNCGLSPAPLNEKNQLYWRRYMAYWGQVDATRVSTNWNSMGEFLDRMSELPLGTNLTFLVGHNTLRSYAMGLEGEGGDRQKPSKIEMEEMTGVLDQCLRVGAFGLSTGLAYPPGRNAATEELVELSRVVASYCGVYCSHLRSGSEPMSGFEEFLFVVRSAGVRGVVSHLRGRTIYYPGGSTGPDANTLLHLMKRCRQDGLDIYFDVIPIPSGSNSVVSTLSGGWGITDFKDIFDDTDSLIPLSDFLEKISNPITRRAIEARVRLHEKALRLNPREDTRLIHYSKNHPEFTGKTIAEVAAMLNLNIIDAIFHLVIEDEGDTRWGNWSHEGDIEQLLEDQFAMPSSDGYWIPYDMQTTTLGGITGPRIYGSFPYFIERYTRLRHILPLEAAVAKMTSVPARVFSIRGRGLVREGKFADLTIFDPEKIRNTATLQEPGHHPIGIHYVLVNGQVAIDQGELTSRAAGRVLRHRKKSGF